LATISKYQTASGATLYRVRYRTPGRGQTDKRGFKTKRDAEAFASNVEVTKARGEYVAPSLGRVTVGELGPAWLVRKEGHLKPSGTVGSESISPGSTSPRKAGSTRSAELVPLSQVERGRRLGEFVKRNFGKFLRRSVLPHLLRRKPLSATAPGDAGY